MVFPVISTGHIRSVVAGMELQPFREHLHGQECDEICIPEAKQVRTLPHESVDVITFVQGRHILPVEKIRTAEQDYGSAILLCAAADDGIVAGLFFFIPDLRIAKIHRTAAFRQHVGRDDRVLFIFDIIDAVSKRKALRLQELSAPILIQGIFYSGVDQKMPAIRRCDRAAGPNAVIFVRLSRGHRCGKTLPMKKVL